MFLTFCCPMSWNWRGSLDLTCSYGAGDADAAWIGQGFQPGGDVDPVAEQFPFPHQHVAQVHPDAKVHSALIG